MALVRVLSNPINISSIDINKSSSQCRTPIESNREGQGKADSSRHEKANVKGTVRPQELLHSHYAKLYHCDGCNQKFAPTHTRFNWK